MNELIRFLKFLYRKKLVLILVPLAAVIAGFFLIRRLPDHYRSQGRIATGLVDKTEQILASGKDAEQESEINRKFDNLIQLMRLRNVIDQVSYRLILHDLTVQGDSLFKPQGKQLQSLGREEKAGLIALYKKKYTLREGLSIWDAREKEARQILEESGYSPEAILDKLTIYRLQNSDYINIEFEGTHPQLTAFVINTLCEEFLSIYADRLRESNNRSLDFLEKFMLQKLDALNGRMEELKQFKIRNRVLNLNEQARSLYGHIIDFETKREIAKKDVAAYGSALKNIDDKFNPADRKYLENSMASINQNIAATREQLRQVNDTYIRSNFNPAYKARVDSLQQVLALKIGESTDKYIYNPLVAKENLVSRKLDLEISLELSENSIQTIESEIARLNRKFDGMVPNEASIQQFETGIDIAGKEYIEALQRYNNARLESNYPITLKQVERAMPGLPQPSKKLLLVAMCGIASLVFCLFVLFVLYYFDHSIWSPAQLADRTGIPVLGKLSRTGRAVNFLDPDDSAAPPDEVHRLKNQLRSLRYEIDEEIYGPRIISFTSLKPVTDRVHVVYGLAWAYAKVNQRVLIIDGNFNAPAITAAQGSWLMEDYFTDRNMEIESDQPGSVQVLGTRGGDVSLLEIADERLIQQKLARLREQFDVILIEADSLQSMNRAKEWITYSDRVAVVFEAGHAIGPRDEPSLKYLRSRGAMLSGWILTNAGNLSSGG